MLQIMNYILLPRLWLARHVQNQSRITPMRRILSFSRIFLFLDILGLGFPSDFVCACTALDIPQQEIIRINPINPRSKKLRG